MAQITWRNVDAPDLTRANRILQSSVKSFERGFDGIGDAAIGVREAQQEQATARASAELAKITGPGDVDAFQKRAIEAAGGAQNLNAQGVSDLLNSRGLAADTAYTSGLNNRADALQERQFRKQDQLGAMTPILAKHLGEAQAAAYADNPVFRGVSAPALASFDAFSKATGVDWSKRINSAYRDPEHNAKVGGAKNSQHTKGNAFDLDVSDMDENQRKAVIQTARQAGFRGVGIYNNALHFDVGAERHWGADYTRKSTPDWAANAQELIGALPKEGNLIDPATFAQLMTTSQDAYDAGARASDENRDRDYAFQIKQEEREELKANKELAEWAAETAVPIATNTVGSTPEEMMKNAINEINKGDYTAKQKRALEIATRARFSEVSEIFMANGVGDELVDKQVSDVENLNAWANMDGDSEVFRMLREGADGLASVSEQKKSLAAMVKASGVEGLQDDKIFDQIDKLYNKLDGRVDKRILFKLSENYLARSGDNLGRINGDQMFADISKMVNQEDFLRTAGEFSDRERDIQEVQKLRDDLAMQKGVVRAMTDRGADEKIIIGAEEKVDALQARFDARIADINDRNNDAFGIRADERREAAAKIAADQAAGKGGKIPKSVSEVEKRIADATGSSNPLDGNQGLDISPAHLTRSGEENPLVGGRGQVDPDASVLKQSLLQRPQAKAAIRAERNKIINKLIHNTDSGLKESVRTTLQTGGGKVAQVLGPVLDKITTNAAGGAKNELGRKQSREMVEFYTDPTIIKQLESNAKLRNEAAFDPQATMEALQNGTWGKEESPIKREDLSPAMQRIMDRNRRLANQ